MNKQLIFYGAGLYAKQSLRSYIAEGFVPVCFADADGKKHHSKITTRKGDSFEILSLDEAIGYYPNYEIIVMVIPSSFNAVKEDLVRRGFDVAHIAPPPFYNKFPFYNQSPLSTKPGNFELLQLLQENLSGSVVKKIEIFPDHIDIVVEIIDNKQIKILYDGSQWTATAHLLECGEWEEQEEAEMMYQLLSIISKEKGATVLDIGANIGYYSMCYSKWFPKINLHSFEPVPKTYDVLIKNMEINDLNNVHLNNFGFFDVEKTVNFCVRKGSLGVDGGASVKNILDLDEYEQVQCRLTTLDSYIKKNNISVDFIKCDVEGSELFVYKGGIETIKESKPVIFSEMLISHSSKFGYHPNDIICFLAELGYKCYIIDGGYLKCIKEVTSETKETNFIFIHPLQMTKFSVLVR